MLRISTIHPIVYLRCPQRRELYATPATECEPMPCTEGLADAIARYRLDACCWAAFHCKTHGDLRAALPSEPPRQKQPCPICQAVCRCVVMALGGTRTSLPAFWLAGPLDRWAAVPTPQLDGATGRFQASVGLG
jgi:hypothetical protein